MAENRDRSTWAATLSRTEIFLKLLDWFDKGYFSTSKTLGITPNEIEQKSNMRELSYTTIPRLFYMGDSNGAGNDVFLDFKALCDAKRILSPLGTKVEKNKRTLYQLQKASQNGEITRFVHADVVIYID